MGSPTIAPAPAVFRGYARTSGSAGSSAYLPFALSVPSIG